MDGVRAIRMSMGRLPASAEGALTPPQPSATFLKGKRFSDLSEATRPDMER